MTPPCPLISTYIQQDVRIRQAEMALSNGKILHVAFRAENGKIIEQQNHYDPRHATG